MDSEADKIKYWQYKLNQKQKKQKLKESKPKPPKAKTPEKIKKHSSILMENNFINTTIQKLKSLLSEASTKKSKEMGVHSTKHSKDLSTYRNNQYEIFKKCKKTEADKRMKSSSVLQLKKDKKGVPDPTFKAEKQSPSKSRSRSKSLKFKVDKPKKEKLRIGEEKSSPSRKTNKKKSLKTTKSTTRKMETLELPNLDEDSSWKKKLMETMIVHRQKNSESPEDENKVISNFRVWQEHQQKMYNTKMKKSKIILAYLKGFLSYRSYLSKKASYQRSSCRNGREMVMGFKNIVKNQQQKLLQLKECLCSLKNSANINEGLEVLIKKVNENITHLQYFDSEEKEQERDGQKSNIFHGSFGERGENNGLKVQKRGSQSYVQQQQRSIYNLQEKEGEPLYKDEEDKGQNKEALKVIFVPAGIQDQSSLNYSHIQKSPQPNAFPSARQSEPSFNLKEESSSLLIDSKFIKIEILRTPAQKETLPPCEQPIPFSQQSQPLPQITVNQSDEDMLLSASVSKKEKFINEIEPLLPTLNTISQKSQLSIINIEQDEYQQHQNPTFQRSPPLVFAPNKSPPQLDHISTNNNRQLINSINHILSSKEPTEQNNFQSFLGSGIGIEKRNQIFEGVSQRLISEFTEVFSSIEGGKEKLVEKYNSNVLEIVKQPPQHVDGNQYEEMEEQSITPINATDEYVIKMTEKVVEQAYRHDLAERISKPLGVPSLVTLKCIRRFAYSQDEEGQGEEFGFTEGQEEMMQQYTQVIDSNLFQLLEQKFSPAPDNPYQLVFNRCIYDTLNLLLDEYRPYGSKGMPGICIPSETYIPPPKTVLISLLKASLIQITQIKMGLLSDQQSSKFLLDAIINKTLQLWKEDVIRYIQRQFNYKEEDDTIERYELMMDVEEQILSQEIVEIQMLRLKRQGIRYQ